MSDRRKAAGAGQGFGRHGQGTQGYTGGDPRAMRAWIRDHADDERFGREARRHPFGPADISVGRRLNHLSLPELRDLARAARVDGRLTDAALYENEADARRRWGWRADS